MSYEAARKATIIAYKNRCLAGMKISGHEFGKTPIRYRGNFPYQEVADSVETPRPFSDKEKLGTQKRSSETRTRIHQYYWDKLFTAFDAAWRAAA